MDLRQLAQTDAPTGALNQTITDWLQRNGFEFWSFDANTATERHVKWIHDTGHIWSDFWEFAFRLRRGEIRISHQKVQRENGDGLSRQKTVSVQELTQGRWDIDRFFEMQMIRLQEDIERAMLSKAGGTYT